MGKIRQGILGGFSGKVGTVVGASWNGIYYMRGLPQSYKKSRSSKQKMQQGYFRELIALSGQLSDDDLNPNNRFAKGQGRCQKVWPSNLLGRNHLLPRPAPRRVSSYHAGQYHSAEVVSRPFNRSS